MSMAKYGNRKTMTSDGILHDSRKEAVRWMELNLMLRAGEIRDLQRQVEYVLIPEQRAESTEVYQSGKNKGKPKEGKLLEREVVYRADFVYTDQKSGERVVEDTKGVKTKDYIIKRKLMLYIHHIRIKEI
jgi:hypothetical protein